MVRMWGKKVIVVILLNIGGYFMDFGDRFVYID